MNLPNNCNCCDHDSDETPCSCGRETMPDEIYRCPFCLTPYKTREEAENCCAK